MPALRNAFGGFFCGAEAKRPLRKV